MKYISGEFGSWDHRPYWQYLDSVKDLMPAHLFRFAANSENHDLVSLNSLHDSWLDYWNIVELSSNQNKKERSLQIEARFLGPRHDRHIYLTYKNVEEYNLQNPAQFAGPPSSKTGHGDLLVHELRIVREGLFSHELIFSRGTVFSVQFADFEHRIEVFGER